MESLSQSSEFESSPAIRLEAIRLDIREKTGERFDAPIEEIVVMMNAFGFYTYQSCGGHIEHEGLDVSGMRWQDIKYLERKVIGGPWIAFSAYDIDEDEAQTDIEEEKYNELEVEKECEEIEHRLMGLLGEFYADRTVPADVRLIFEGEGIYELRNQGTLLLRNIHVLSRAKREAKLAAYRAEMNDFASFLKAKYLAQSQA